MPKQDRSRATRDRILRSTISCLAEFGWHGTTTTLVAERTGISRGALQHHFPKREDLFLTAIDFIFDEQKQEGVLGVDAAPTKGDDFDFIVEKVLEYYASDVFKAALQIWSVGASEPTLKERIRPLENKFARGIYDQTVTFLNADVSDERTHRFIQTTLDLARGLGLADLLSDDSARRKRIAKFWAGEMRSIKQLDSDE
ncbi:TetR/AcrR family transcriptional regulator [Brevibacterium linens]|nr:TetR/AcrR family transcriptional regulator [Brevibacterium linens]